MPIWQYDPQFDVVGLVGQLCAATILFNAAVLKLVSMSIPQTAASKLAGLSRAHAKRLIGLIISAELAAGTLLVMPRTRAFGTALALILSCCFALAAAVAMHRGLNIGCGCLGNALPGLRLGASSLMLAGVLSSTAIAATIQPAQENEPLRYLATVTALIVTSVGLAIRRRLLARTSEIGEAQ